jgi:hypothetical protein
MDLEILEALALSDDRGGAIAQLLPGSEDHDYYRALHAQQRGALDEAAAAVIAAWPGRHGKTRATIGCGSASCSTGSPHRPKVYARKRGGAVEFYKDGYTDLRGWFDYATLSTTELDAVERFAILVCSDRAGAAIVEAGPPAR